MDDNNIADSPDDKAVKDEGKDNLTEVPMELDPTSVLVAKVAEVEAPKDCLIEMPMELDLDLSCLTETRKSHMITCPVCFEISVLSKQSKLYENIIAACMKGNSKI